MGHANKVLCGNTPLRTARCSSLAQVRIPLTPPHLITRRSYSTETTGDQTSYLDDYKYTTTLNFEKPEKPMDCYRVMDQSGNILPGAVDPGFDKEETIKIYKAMMLVNVMDSIMYDIQRQGRVSFYMTSFGEEATHFGSAAALKMEDVIFGQYREVGVLMWRGFTLDDIMNQCCSNQYDHGKGRQMPVHYGSKRHNFQTISSPLATQIPQAVGSAYYQKLLAAKSGEASNCTVVYFGEGAASEGDFHAAMNFSTTLETPTIFFCRNNKWAISTPAREQYRGDGIAARGIAYGMHTIRVDGNDLWAIYNATKEARRIATEKLEPVLIEAMTYRVGHHSTSDDSSRYRTSGEVSFWREQTNPITRLRNYMVKKGWWTEDQDTGVVAECRQNVREALGRAEKQLKPAVEHLFTDVYDTIPEHLDEQKRELEAHLKLYPDAYPTDIHSKSL